MDKYLRKFVNYCKREFKDELIAIVIYGSYIENYFKKEKSDYDVFIIFKDRIPRKRKNINKRFRRISLQYFCNIDDIKRYILEGHWAIYITLLKRSKTLFKTKEYNKLIQHIRNMPHLKNNNILGIERKRRYIRNVLIKKKGYDAIKWALPELRKRLQLLTYIKKNSIIWDINKNLELNKQILTIKENYFIRELQKKESTRSDKFSKSDKKYSLHILDKLDNILLES
ncbi:nucleotidyltransferase domain-containing protein [Candidatus Woesearchaeota archaeon]|nr:nucleotidyltransferase domain-containing protein [Candidatus Woesearchaeota archaeon]